MSQLKIPEPWHSFFLDLDEALNEKIALHCLGGFVVSMCYGLERQTADIDFVSIVPSDQRNRLLELGGEGSALHKKYKVYLHAVTVANVPCEYETRLREICPGAYRKIRLFALDPYDLALSKLSRNVQRDRDDVKYLVKSVPLDRDILKGRYEEELRPVYVGNLDEADGSMKLWLEAFYEQ
jgi:Nucleotidyltransferase of unknown function (DUF6036)